MRIILSTLAILFATNAIPTEFRLEPPDDGCKMSQCDKNGEPTPPTQVYNYPRCWPGWILVQLSDMSKICISGFEAPMMETK